MNIILNIYNKLYKIFKPDHIYDLVNDAECVYISERVTTYHQDDNFKGKIKYVAKIKYGDAFIIEMFRKYIYTKNYYKFYERGLVISSGNNLKEMIDQSMLEIL